jgi:hypothetical protein
MSCIFRSVDPNDKLPEELNREEFFVVKLSQADKLFRVGDRELKQ